MMSARNLLRQVFRHGPRDKVNADALPLGIRQMAAGNNIPETAASENKLRNTARTFTPTSRTPEPFGLEDIAEEAAGGSPSTIETASHTESATSLDLDTSFFSIRELVEATIDEAKTIASSHLDTIDMTLALLDALDGFSATISELRKEFRVKKEACEEKLTMLEAVERAVNGMVFAEETYDQNTRHGNER